MPDGGTITVTSENKEINEPIEGCPDIKNGSYTLITVSDTGVGIAPEELESIFEPFYTTKEHGTGIGLSLSKQIMLKLGGDIKLLAMLGAFLGWQSLPFIFFASSLSGAVIGIIAMYIQKKGGATRIPFGPFLSLAALFYLFFKETIHRLFLLYISGQLF